MSIHTFRLWEGDAIVTLDIKDKGGVRFWYDLDRIPRIDSIKDMNTTFDCFYINDNSAKKEYAYTINLDLGNETLFSKWFPFRVNSINDLIKHYDAIVRTLQTFPKNPSLVEYKDSYGDRSVLENPNKEFIIKSIYQDKPVECDIYLLENANRTLI